MKATNVSVWQYSSPMRSEELYHYASPYYDPVKAHEYYMRHRVLKGRQTMTGINKEGREIAKVIKENFNEELGSESKKLRSDAEKKSAEKKAAIQKDIASIRAKLKGMNKEERAKNKPEALRDINDLRDQIKMERASILSQLGVDIGNLNDDYDNKYNAELDKLRSSYATSTAGKKKKAKTAKKTTQQATVQTRDKKPRIQNAGRRIEAMTK